MTVSEYKQKIKQYRIEKYGFDTHARVLGIGKEEVKSLWNEATNNSFKRFPRTEYYMRYMPEISTKFNPYWELHLPDGYDFLMFYMTPTSPILIPHKFITDKGSIPLIAQNLISNYDREMMMAFLVHDVECEMQRMTTFTTDGLLYEVGTEMGANWVKKNLIYAAVRMAAFTRGKDKIRNGFNVSKYNRELISRVEVELLRSSRYAQHLDFLEKTTLTHDKI